MCVVDWSEHKLHVPALSYKCISRQQHFETCWKNLLTTALWNLLEKLVLHRFVQWELSCWSIYIFSLWNKVIMTVLLILLLENKHKNLWKNYTHTHTKGKKSCNITLIIKISLRRISAPASTLTFYSACLIGQMQIKSYLPESDYDVVRKKNQVTIAFE